MKKPIYPKFKEFKLSRRKFLNPKEGLAAIQTSVDIGFNSLSASIDITDCNRKVSLDFYVYEANTKELQAKLKKLDILLNSIQEFKADIQAAVKEINKRKPSYDQYNKDKKAWNKTRNKTSVFDELDLMN